MIRIGFVGGSDKNHPVNFAKMFNGMNQEHRDLCPLGGGQPMTRIEGARVVKVFDEDRQAAENLAKLTGIDQVVDSLDEMYDGIDAVYLGDDLSLQQHRYAEPFIERGIPTFIDKPLADSVERARELVDLASQRGCLLMSSSALKYAKETAPMHQGETDIGEVAMACTMGPANLKYGRAFLFYGMHAVTLGHCRIGSRPVEVVDCGDRGRTVVRVRYMNGAQLVVMCPHDVPVRFQGLFQGTKGAFHCQVSDAAHFYSEMLRDFLRMVEAGEQTFDLLEALEVIAICCAAEQSVADGCAVRLG